MSTIYGARNKGRKFWFYAVLVVIMSLIVGLFGVSVVGAKGNGGRACYGTYLVDLGQSEGIWTLSKDGTVQVTDSAEVVFGFSHQQGSWKHTVAKEAKATWLDFAFDPDAVAPAGYSRIDADFVFGKGCDTFAGTLDRWSYGPGEDPLDRTTGGNGPFAATFTGRRVNP